MSVTVRNKNGIRFGEFEIHGIKGYFPRQAITTTNLNHSKYLRTPYLDFKTSVLEIIEKNPLDLVSDRDYRKRRIKAVSKVLEDNADKLCLLVLRGIRNSAKITKPRNESIIDFQIECGFKLIKVFFPSARNALQYAREYRKRIPHDRSVVFVLDENLEHSVFRDLYMDALNHNDEIIGFAGREPSRTDYDNKLNFQFVASREKDGIIRLASFVKKSFGGVVGSLVYHAFGFDLYSFMTRFGNPNSLPYEMKALAGFRYEPLVAGTEKTCVVTGMNLFHSSKRFEGQNKSSLPVSVHDIVRLNEEFEQLHENYTRDRLRAIAENALP